MIKTYTLNTLMPRVCYTYKTMIKNVNAWFKTRARCFLYHYPVDEYGNSFSEQWQNLNRIAGCCYHGWTRLGDRTRGELWTFKTNKNKMLIQMQIDPKQLMFKKHFISLQKELNGFKRKLARKKIYLLPNDYIIF